MDNYIKEEKKKYIQEDQVLRLSHKRERERERERFINILHNYYSSSFPYLCTFKPSLILGSLATSPFVLTNYVKPSVIHYVLNHNINL